jgi:hypothetical protein
VTNAVVLGALLVSFAVFVTCHVAIAARLFLSARPRYRGLVALVVLPLAPMWAYQERWLKLCWTWVGSVASYALAVAVASFVAA